MQEINLYDLIKYYAKNWFFILTLMAVGLIGGLIYNSVQTPLYKSDATLLVVNSSDMASQDVTKINNYVELFKSRRVLEPVIAAQHLGVTYDQLVKSINATNEKNTEVIKVSISSDSPDKSEALANNAVNSFMKQIATIYTVDNVQIVDEASNAISPFNVHKGLQLALAITIGFVSSCIVLFFVYDFHSDRKNVIKKASNKTRKYRVLYNTSIRLTGRVGYVAPIAKLATIAVPKQRKSTRGTTAKASESVIAKLKGAKFTPKPSVVKSPVTKKTATKPVAKKVAAKKNITKKR